MLPYWTALGRFVFYYAQLEEATFNLYRVFVIIPPHVARCIFSGLRITDALNNLKRIFSDPAFAGKPPPGNLLEAFGKVAEITTIRNDILHYGVQFSDRGMIVTDAWKQMPHRVKESKITNALIDDLSADVIKCIATFTLWNISRLPEPHPFHEEWKTAAVVPWRYKPLPLARALNHKGAKQPRVRQRRPFREKSE